MSTTYYEIQLMDRATGQAIIASGGKVAVITAGGTAKKTLLNADTGASLTNPMTPTRGKIRFGIGSVTPIESTVDLYIMAPGGQFVVARSVQAGKPTEIWVDTARREFVLILPFDITDTSAATETDTGFDFVTGMTVLPFPTFFVSTTDSGITLDVGLLSSESGGDADGFIDAASVASAGSLVPTSATTATVGALIRETLTDSGSATSSARSPYEIGATAVSISYTLSSGADTANGYFELSYRLGITA